ncbi:MAG: hypothetical protein V3V00_03320 [Saprospiraceae bacterium]
MKETENELGNIKPEKLKLDLELVQKAWNEHRNTVSSPSAKATLEKVVLSISESVIKVVVPSGVSKEEISQEISLYQKLRKIFNNNDLNIIVDIDRGQFPDMSEDQSAKMYTMKEKYDYLTTKNSELDNFVKKLNLKIDQE